ncbi:MAG: nucleotidyl transferase AbiEii/AbiGii toxin family protein [Bacteroidetes bacterium]|nr:nucleotidyl transferase AbiEii/AbiGii toxin family protein [Bacteroidota bacterium]
MQKPYLQGFCLVGGTSLSLQIGHRISVDLDMFSTEPFETAELKSQLAEDFPTLQVVMERTNTLICIINEVKVDFIRFKYGFLYPIVLENNIRLASIKDIASMKLDAISGRGKKKDFFDLYFLLQLFSLPELLAFYQAKYHHTTIFHVIKSINFFEDAEEENDPIVLDKNLNWEKVKKTINEKIQKL